jgi:chemotaxis signal transduction protein
MDHRRTLLAFRIAGHRLALPLAAIRLVAPVPLLAPPIAAPHFVEGYFDFQGTPVPAIRLDRLFGLDDVELGLYAPLLILAGADAIALHIETVDGLVKIAPSSIQPIGEGDTLNGCVVGRIGEGSDTIYVADADRLLLAAERETLAAHRAMMQRRLAALESDAVHAS